MRSWAPPALQVCELTRTRSAHVLTKRSHTHTEGHAPCITPGVQQLVQQMKARKEQQHMSYNDIAEELGQEMIRELRDIFDSNCIKTKNPNDPSKGETSACCGLWVHMEV